MGFFPSQSKASSATPQTPEVYRRRRKGALVVIGVVVLIGITAMLMSGGRAIDNVRYVGGPIEMTGNGLSFAESLALIKKYEAQGINTLEKGHWTFGAKTLEVEVNGKLHQGPERYKQIGCRVTMTTASEPHGVIAVYQKINGMRGLGSNEHHVALYFDPIGRESLNVKLRERVIADGRALFTVDEMRNNEVIATNIFSGEVKVP